LDKNNAKISKHLENITHKEKRNQKFAMFQLWDITMDPSRDNNKI
jgi:hypothetical protein